MTLFEDFKERQKKTFQKYISIDDIRDLNRKFSLSSTDYSYKICIVDTTEDLNLSASNSLLKILCGHFLGAYALHAPKVRLIRTKNAYLWLHITQFFKINGIFFMAYLKTFPCLKAINTFKYVFIFGL